MKVWGLTDITVTQAVLESDLCVRNLREDGRAFAFALKPSSTHDPLARVTPRGRRVLAPCYHALRDAVSLFFALGATRVQSRAGDWKSALEFEADLPRLASLTLQSGGVRKQMKDLCGCVR